VPAGPGRAGPKRGGRRRPGRRLRPLRCAPARPSGRSGRGCAAPRQPPQAVAGAAGRVGPDPVRVRPGSTCARVSACAAARGGLSPTPAAVGPVELGPAELRARARVRVRVRVRVRSERQCQREPAGLARPALHARVPIQSEPGPGPGGGRAARAPIPSRAVPVPGRRRARQGALRGALRFAPGLRSPRFKSHPPVRGVARTARSHARIRRPESRHWDSESPTAQ
jgi:hypothetical protein